MSYSIDCKTGRAAALSAIHDAQATGNLPRLTQQIRQAATDPSGAGAGFLAVLAATLTDQAIST